MQQLEQLDAARRHSEQEMSRSCSVSGTALVSTDRLSSTRVIQLLESLHTQLVRHAAVPAVDGVLHSVSTALRAR